LFRGEELINFAYRNRMIQMDGTIKLDFGW
jgi:hypothetical protein